MPPPIVVTSPANNASISCSGPLAISGTSDYPNSHYIVYLRDPATGVTYATWDSTTDGTGGFSGTQTPSWNGALSQYVFVPFVDPGSGAIQGTQTFITCGATPPPTWGDFRYIADDGSVHTVNWYAANEASAAGNLPAGVTGDPAFPSLWVPRYFSAEATIAGMRILERCICNSGNSAFVGGPGTTVTIGGVTYTVQTCHGERRGFGS